MSILFFIQSYILFPSLTIVDAELTFLRMPIHVDLHGALNSLSLYVLVILNDVSSEHFVTLLFILSAHHSYILRNSPSLQPLSSPNLIHCQDKTIPLISSAFLCSTQQMLIKSLHSLYFALTPYIEGHTVKVTSYLTWPQLNVFYLVEKNKVLGRVF